LTFCAVEWIIVQMKTWLRICIFAPLSLLTVLFIGELAVRYLQVTIPDRENMPFRRDEDCGYTLVPSAPGEFAQDDNRYINTLGFRDREHEPGKPPGRRRIIGLGDSFVYGNVPIADNFLRLLEDSLSTDVCLAGLPGWDVRNAAGFMKGAGRDLQADLAVLCFSIGSDVTGVPLPGRVYQGNLYFTGSQDPLRNLMRKSRLFVVFKQLHYRRWLRNLRRMRDPDIAAARTLARERHNLPKGVPYFEGMFGESIAIDQRTPADPGFLQRQADNLILYARQPDPRLESWWEQAEAQLLDFDTACRAAGCRWVLLAAPAEIQVDPAVQKAVLQQAGAHRDDYDFTRPNRRLEHFALAHGLTFVDPTSELLAAAQETGTRQYIPNNGHWNVPGNRLIASILATHIKRSTALAADPSIQSP
jgi:hypothetical protein